MALRLATATLAVWMACGMQCFLPSDAFSSVQTGFTSLNVKSLTDAHGSACSVLHYGITVPRNGLGGSQRSRGAKWRAALSQHDAAQVEPSTLSRRIVTLGGVAVWFGVLHPMPVWSSVPTVHKGLPPSAYVTLNNGAAICRLQTGLLQLSPKTSRAKGSNSDDEAYWEVDTNRAVTAMKQLVDSGMTTFDLAGYYGNAEDIAGEFVRQTGRVPGVSFNSKWIPTGSSPKSKEEVRMAVEKAKERMGVDAGVMQFYWWDYDKPYYVDMLALAQELVDEGALRGIGLTGMDTRRVREIVARGVRVSTVQGSFSIVDTRPRDGGMTKLCAEEGIVFVGHGALCGGLLSEQWIGAPEPEAQGKQLPTSQLRKYYRWICMWGSWTLFQELLQTLKGIADKHKVSVSNVALKWVLQQHAVGSVVVGARLGAPEQQRQTQDNLRVLSESWTLDAQDLQAIAAVQAKGKPLLDFLGDVGNEFHVKARGLKKKKASA